ncbi:MAG: type II toxin-antitoxin system VapB family antitoxin [Pigmentiphaga sp.]|nr:type II toxin-antitoxin system VapB family antitoxin [Pigmentiphaga sp.]
MRKVALFRNGKNQAVRLPMDMAYEGVEELEISREGDVTTLRPVRPSWVSFADVAKADPDFLRDREPVIDDANRFVL